MKIDARVDLALTKQVERGHLQGITVIELH